MCADSYIETSLVLARGVLVDCWCWLFACRALSASGDVLSQQHLVTTVVDVAGFQNPATCGRRDGATFTDLCQNHIQETLHGLFQQSNMTSIIRLCTKVRFVVCCQNLQCRIVSSTSIYMCTIRYDTIEEFNVDSKAEYLVLSSTRSQKKKLKQTTPVCSLFVLENGVKFNIWDVVSAV